MAKTVDFQACWEVLIVCIGNEKNCPTAWKWMYCGHIREPSIILEVVALYDLWI